MIKLLFGTLISLSLLFFTGCEKKEETNTASMTKCEAGKCDSAMQKSEVPAQKFNADTKDGDH
ncbi:hypothetical protein PF327_07795 [Sulfurovum sp. XTW-4]|uniref:Lipoprotein n=1 Tax=Sulfurovum xiamenensis TaxID=3019066 RepID=A0ABT7QSW1_9BACT|nr:hypothetical protein [Sulfurovum xiamenensis]MDM5264095.1 hypothetical protein [Sulfurovum xiamenensis]